MWLTGGNELVTGIFMFLAPACGLMIRFMVGLNTEMPAYSKVSCFKLYQEEFEKTPKRSIKRYLYQPAEEN